MQFCKRSSEKSSLDVSANVDLDKIRMYFQGHVLRGWLNGASVFCVRPAGVIPDESKALSLMAPANAVAGMLPGGGLLPTPTPVPSVSIARCLCLGFWNTVKDLYPP